MIRLSKLRMKNFKSFKQAMIPFSNGFTVIAGPNGSGKSNIMDAVLFALGETSLKSLRAGRLTDLVYGGRDNTDNYAVVNLTLEDPHHTYELSRTIDKQGKSVYRLNEKRVTLSEIQNLIAELGVRVDGHNMVSQGDILRIIDMNPVERRELIDEIAGLQEFEEKKNEALKDLEKVERKIKDVTIVLNERMAIIEQLAQEKEVAQRYQKLDTELKQTKATILHVESKELNEKLEHIVTKEVEFVEKKQESATKLGESRKGIQELEREFSELDQKMLASQTQAYGKHGKGIEEHKADLRVNEERIQHTHKRLEELSLQKEEWEKDIREIKKSREKYPHITEQKQAIHDELLETEHALGEHQGHAYAHAETLKHLQKAKSTCPICQRDLSSKMKKKLTEEKQEAHTQAQKRLKDLETKKQKLQTQFEEIRETEIALLHLSKSNNKLKHLLEEEKQIRQQINEFEEKRKKLEETLRESETQYQKFLGTNQALLQKREKAHQKLAGEREKERAWQEKVFRIEGQISELKIEQGKFDTRLQDIKEELKNYEGVPTLDRKDVVELRKRIPGLEHEIKQLGNVNLKALEDFSQYEKDALEIREKSRVLDEERLAVFDLINSIDVKRTEAFMKTFNAISNNFNKLYTSFFDGTAKLDLTNPNKPLESGLIIEAKHAGEKMFKGIDSMSGGEKSLTSLAFIFAIQLYEPAPFYFFDEVDAALDMTNSKKVGVLIKEMSKESQFISITHNDSVLKVADQIVGVAKSNTNSSIIGLKTNSEITANA